MKNILLTAFALVTSSFVALAQPCSTAQALTSTQETQITNLLPLLDSALKHEDLFHIDSLSNELKAIYGTQGGIPDAIEFTYDLVDSINWVTLTNALLLSRNLVDYDSLLYVDLWKTGKGMSPPLYQPHSLFLRAGAEIASGLLKIADKETDLTRKSLYESWANRTFDSLATMQLSSGAFPFPDLRTYGDPVFTPIIQNFIDACGADSVNVLQDGWIVDDKNTGEFKFDAGVIANAFYEAFQYTGNINYKNITIAIGDYLKTLPFNVNYNYNTFVSLGLTRAYELTNDTTYLNRAILNLRYGVFPGQLANGRWVDGHNANSRYHSIIIQNMVSTTKLLPLSSPYKTELETMTYKAVKNMVEYTYNCNSTTGYRWLLKAYTLNASVIPATLKDSMFLLIAQHTNESVSSYKYLDVPTIGDYLELLGTISSVTTLPFPVELNVNAFPNPTGNFVNIVLKLAQNDAIELTLFDASGKLLHTMDSGTNSSGTFAYQLNLTEYNPGIYFVFLRVNNKTYVQKIMRIE